MRWACVALHLALVAADDLEQPKAGVGELRLSPLARLHIEKDPEHFDFFGELREDQCQDDLDCGRSSGRTCIRRPNDAAGRCRCPVEQSLQDGRCVPVPTEPGCKDSSQCGSQYLECVEQRCRCMPPNILHGSAGCGPASEPAKSSWLSPLAFLFSILLLMTCTVFLTRYRKEDDGFDEEELSEAGASPWERSGLRGLLAKRLGVQDGQGAPVQGQSGPPTLSPSGSRQVAGQPPPEEPPAPAPPPHQQSEEQQRDRQDPLFATNVQEAAPSTSPIAQRRSSDDVRLPPFVACSPVQPSELGVPNCVPVQRLRRGLELVSAGPRGLMLQHLLDGRDLFEREEETSDETRPSKNVQTDISLAPAVIPFAAMETNSWSFMCTQGTDAGDSAKKPTENPNPSKDVDSVRAKSPSADAQEMGAAAKRADDDERPLGDSSEVPPLRSPPPVHASSPYCLKKTSSDELTRLLVLEHRPVRHVEELSCEPYDDRIGAKGPEMSSRPEDETSFQSFDADADARARAVLLQACRSPRSEVQ